MSLSQRSLLKCHTRLMMWLQQTPRRSVHFITREMGESLAKRAAVSLAVLYELVDIACSFSSTLTRRCHLAPQTPFAIYSSLNPAKSILSARRRRNRRDSLVVFFSHRTAPGTKTWVDRLSTDLRISFYINIAKLWFFKFSKNHISHFWKFPFRRHIQTLF